MHIDRTRGSILGGVAAVLIVSVVWPGPLDQLLPGWTQHTQVLREILPGIRPAAGAVTDTTAPVSVEMTTVQKGAMPLRFTSTGSVQAIATVAVRTRIDAALTSLPVPDGASVKAGQVIAVLDTRQIDAQIEQAKAALAKDQTVIVQANRDLGQARVLLERGAGPQETVDTDSAALKEDQATVAGDQAQIDNLNVQRSWYTLTSPINGRLGAFSAKVGNIVRSADTSAAGVLVTINQMSPIYVAFAVPQTELTDIRQAMAAGGGVVTAIPQGVDPSKAPKGKIAVISNSVDPTTGDVMLYATFDNKDETLWPGEYCDVVVDVRVDQNIVSVPQAAVQQGQDGKFVFTVDQGTAHLQPITVARIEDGRAVISQGLKGGENIVTDGQYLLLDGSKVSQRSGNSPLQDNAAPM